MLEHYGGPPAPSTVLMSKSTLPEGSRQRLMVAYGLGDVYKRQGHAFELDDLVG